MTDRDALLAAVHASPADDAPRLIVADWFEENGQPERAAFIRIQIAMRREYEAHQRATARLEQLFLEQRRLFRMPWADMARTCLSSVVAHYSRGFFDRHVRITASLLGPGLPDVVTWVAPHVTYYVRDVHENTLVNANDWPALAFIEDLVINWIGPGERQVSTPDLAALLSSHHLCRLTSLQVAHLDQTRRLVEVICTASNLDKLRHLCLRGNRLGTAALLQIADNPRFQHLETLDLGDTGATVRGLEAVLRSPHLRSLQQIHVSDTDFTVPQVEALREQGGPAITFAFFNVRS